MDKPKLSAELSQSIDVELRRMHDLVQHLDAADECGIECQQFREEREQLIKHLEAFKRHFT